MVKITILNDNRCDDEKLECEHGLSLLIEDGDKKVLFDTGQTDIYLKNAKKLDADLSDVESIILSHGDYDHGNGLKYFGRNVNLICHPDFIKNRISKRTGKYDGLNQTKEDLEGKFNLILTSKPYAVTKNITFLGQIDRVLEFEKGNNLPMIDDDGETYEHFDDSGVVIKTDHGIIVISGCAHSGICNTIEYAKKVSNCDEVLAVIGGFHLKEVDLQTKETIEYMKKAGVKQILVAHCTSDVVCDWFKKELPDITTIVETGKTYFFE